MNNLKIGKKITQLRKEKGITQSELADMLNVSPKTVSKWEVGNSLPTIDILEEMAKVFDVSIDELTGEKKVSKKSSKPPKMSDKTFDLILVGAALACGICLIVTSMLGSVDTKSGFTMIGLGLVGISLFLLRKIK